jgi:hypothetical protein
MKEGNSRDAIDKLRGDLDALQTTMMINPEGLAEISPSLPELFPKELIPEEKCQKLFGSLLSCLVYGKFDNVKCESEQHKFYHCKRWRDAILFKRIKEWEIGFFDSLSEPQKDAYVSTLKLRKLDYIKQYEITDLMPRNRGKRMRFSSDIEQLTWRLKYLDNIVKNTFNV